MLVIRHQKIVIFFGDGQHAVDKSKDTLVSQPHWQLVTGKLGAEKLFGVNQCHGIYGVEIKEESDPHQIIKTDADFLCTDQKGYGLAVTTADCVPLAMYDSQKQVVAMVHAGWKGLVTGVLEQALQKMLLTYGSKPEDIELFIGPCARYCCYEVQQDVYDLLEQKVGTVLKEVSRFFEGHIFVDLALLTRLLLLQNDSVQKNIYTQYSACTLCTADYCSYRRQKRMVRNITAIMLRE